MKATIVILVIAVGGCFMMEKKAHDMERESNRREVSRRELAESRALNYLQGAPKFDESDYEYISDELQSRVMHEKRDRLNRSIQESFR
jgi:hypothetical protein